MTIIFQTVYLEIAKSKFFKVMKKKKDSSNLFIINKKNLIQKNSSIFVFVIPLVVSRRTELGIFRHVFQTR